MLPLLEAAAAGAEGAREGMERGRRAAAADSSVDDDDDGVVFALRLMDAQPPPPHDDTPAIVMVQLCGEKAPFFARFLQSSIESRNVFASFSPHVGNGRA